VHIYRTVVGFFLFAGVGIFGLECLHSGIGRLCGGEDRVAVVGFAGLDLVSPLET